MGKESASRGISRLQWLDAGLDALTRFPATDIKVDSLAHALGIARAGFYWHFKNRENYITQLLEHWLHKVTEAIIKNPDILAMAPKTRLIVTAEFIHDNDLARAEPSILLLAAQDKSAAKVVRKANKLRLQYVSNALEEMGFEGDDLTMRAMLYIAYHSWETTVFSDVSRKRRRELIVRRIELITSQQLLLNK
jgi:AcrR family transcriptional regulator